MNAQLPPWMEPLQQQLEQALVEDRLPQAWLVHGPSGLGKREWALQARQTLLCDTEQGCGSCKNCHLLAAGAHPDTQYLQPDGKWIKVEQIRHLIHWATLSVQQGRRKVCIIDQADRMNLAAANALLKTLEEPPGDALFLLLADTMGGIPPTIRSRCRLDHIALPPAEQAQEWLRSLFGPSAVVEQALFLALNNPGRAAEWLREERLPAMLEWVSQLFQLWQQPSNLPVVQTAASVLPIEDILHLCWCISAECIKIATGEARAGRFLPVRPVVGAGQVPALFALQKQAWQSRALLGSGMHEEGLLLDWLLNWIKAGRST